MSLLCISNANDKVPFPNLSLFPGKDCGAAAQHCGKDCYALKFTRFYPSVFDAWRKNSEAFRHADASGEWQPLRDELDAYLQRRRREPVRFFRIHVAGDFLSQAHVDFWAQLAAAYPQIKFLVFTKQFHFSYSGCSANLQVIYSMWPGLPDTAPVGARRAWMQDGTEERIPTSAIECPGHCGHCGLCWSISEVGRDVYFHKH